MANQGAQLILRPVGGPEGSEISVPVTVVDTDGSNATFDDLNGASVWTPDRAYKVVDFLGEGTTAPASINRVQFNVNSTNRQKFVDLAAAYSATSERPRRIGAAAGGIIPQGASLQLIGRA